MSVTPTTLIFWYALGILAHLLRMEMEPKYSAFRFGDWTPQFLAENMTIDTIQGVVWHTYFCLPIHLP